MHLPKNIPLKAALLTLALAASHVAHAATFQDEAIAFATNNPMSLTVQGDDVTVNLTTNVSLLPGVHVEQNEEAPCPIGLTTSNENGNDTLTIKRADNTQPCKAIVVVNSVLENRLKIFLSFYTKAFLQNSTPSIKLLLLYHIF